MTAQSEVERQIEFTDAVIETMIDGVAVCHGIDRPPHVRFTIWNPAMAALTGYSIDEINRLGWYQTVYVDPAVQERARQRMERMRQGEDLMREEWVITRKDGTHRTVEISTRVVHRESVAVHVMAVMRDVSERKQRESEMLAMRHSLAATLDAMPDLVFEVDGDGRYHDFHSPRADLLIAPPAELIGRTVEEVLPAGAAAVCMNALREAEVCGRSHGRQYELTLPQGHLWFELSIARKPAAPGAGARFIAIARDITARKRAEEALRANEMQLQRILESTADGILAVDCEGRVIRTNRRFAELWRIPQDLLDRKDDAALLAHVMDQLVDPQAFAQKVRSLYASDAEETDTVDFRDGRVFKRFTAPLMLEGALVGRVWSFRDVTASRRAVAALADSHQLLQTIIDTAPVRVFWKDVHLQYLGCNPAFARDAGMPGPADVIGKNDHQLAWREQADRYRADDRQVMESGVARIAYEEPQTLQDGKAIWLRTSKVPLRDQHGRIIGVLGIYEDYTAYRQAEDALRRSESRSTTLAALLRNMCDNVPDLIWMKDLDKRYLFANKSMCSELLCAVDTAEPVGKTDLFFAERQRAGHPGDPRWHTFGECCQDSDDVTLRNDAPSVFEEHGYVRGRYVYYEVCKAPFRNEQGEVIGVVGSARDVTARRQAESELQQYREGLEKLVQQRTAELVAT